MKADVASLYPSLMRELPHRAARDRLGVLLALVDRLVEQRLAAKARARAARARLAGAAHPRGAVGGDEDRGQLGLRLPRRGGAHALCRRARRQRGHAARARGARADRVAELARRGVTLLEADTDGVYFAVPDAWSEADERRVVAEVAALLPPRVQLEFDGRYARDALARAQELRAAALRGRAPAARRRLSLEPGRALRRALSARWVALPARGRRSRFAREFIAR